MQEGSQEILDGQNLVELAVGKGFCVAAKHRAPLPVGHTQSLLLNQLCQLQGWAGREETRHSRSTPYMS